MQTGSDRSGEFSILVVDDERDILDLIKEMCHGRPWVLETRTSPLEALDLARRRRFDAAVIDLYMPELPGLLLHAKLKMIDPELAGRTLFITGYFDREELRRDLEPTGKVLLKPFRPAELTDIVACLLPDSPRESPQRPAHRATL